MFRGGNTFASKKYTLLLITQERVCVNVKGKNSQTSDLNFSDITLPPEAKLFLAKGTGFVSSRKPDRDKLHYDTRELIRNIAWRAHHNTNNDEENREEQDTVPTDLFPRALYIKRTGWPPFQQPGIEELKTEMKQLVDTIVLSRPTPNLTKAETRGQNWCKSMMRLGKLVFTRADKGGSVLVMNPQDVDKAIRTELSKSDGYSSLPEDPNDGILKNQKLLIENLINNGSFNNKILETITGYTERGGKMRKTCFKTRTGIPYPLFKIHKLDPQQILDRTIPPSRLVHALTQSPTTRLEQFLAHHFGQVSRNYASDEYIKDTNDFLHQIKEVGIEEGELLYTLDVKALYPSMDQTIVLQSVRAALEEDRTLTPEIRSGILPCIEFCLQNSTLEYRGMYFKAIKGVPTGGSISRPLADTFLKFLKLHLKSKIPEWDVLIRLWKRYIDDIFGIWRGTKEEFEDFVSKLNSESSTYGIEFTGDGGRELSFLDVKVRITDPEHDTPVTLATSLFKKPTDNRSFLQRNSHHPPHVFKSVPYSQLLRTKTICSDEDTFMEAAQEIMGDFKKSGYRDAELKAALTKASLVNRDQRLTPRENTSESMPNSEHCNLILSTQYCKELNEIRSFLEDKKQTIEHIIGKQVSITIAHRRDNNIADEMFKRRRFATTSADSAPNSINTADITSQACNRPRCLTCKLTSGTANGTLTVNKQIIRLDMRLNCSNENVIYVAQCKLCDSGFYFGQTWLTLSTRMNSHRAAFKPGCYTKSALSMHISEMHQDKLSEKLSNFNLGIIKQCSREELNMFEDIYIEKFKARIIGLNRSKVTGN